MAAAGHATVVLTEDHCIAGKDWLSTLLLRLGNSRDVVGGGMGNNRRKRAVDWGAFFAEYGFFSGTRPADRGGAPLLTGANVCYADSVSLRVGEWARAGTWENVIHDRLREEGARFGFVPEAWVFQNQEYGISAFCRDRFEHGRDYARDRVSETGGSGRWRWLVGTPVLPFLLAWRVGVAAAGLSPGAFLRALPLTWLFLAAWATGEAAGYWAGPWLDQGETHE
jgi:hypothetical protein